MAELDRDRFLALSYVRSSVRPALEALWRLDAALGAVLTSGREPLISQIKLAWWRDALEALDTGSTPFEPALQAVAAHLLPRRISGSELAPMPEGWTLLLTPDPMSADELSTYGARRGAVLFKASAKLLAGEEHSQLAAAGEAWALIDLARHSGSEADAQAALEAARARLSPHRWPRRLRPLGMLAVLAARDAEPARPRWEEQGAPGRMLRMLSHRFTGR
ncbi:MAG TPA: squalene/phytoene synthase family protein [Allosphingosinicella sp.]|nr:squalene/phytoene synthase family protein [Allosphingosinicella sp.]